MSLDEDLGFKNHAKEISLRKTFAREATHMPKRHPAIFIASKATFLPAFLEGRHGTLKKTLTSKKRLQENEQLS